MKRKMLASCLIGIEVFIILLGIIFYVLMVPDIITSFGSEYPEFAYLVTPGIIAISLSAIPLCAALYAFSRICINIANDKSFSKNNSRLLTAIGICTMTDTIYCFIYTIYLYIVGVNHISVIIFSFGMITFGLTVSIASFLLSHLAGKVSDMEKEIELTV
jgi:hypothetical protein